MKHTTRVKRAALALVTLALVACSAALDWDPDGLACDASVVDGRTDFCLKGYSCLSTTDAGDVGRCVHDRSLKLNDGCTQTQQCQTGQVCPLDLVAGGGIAGSDGVKRCLTACNESDADPYYLASSCATGFVCAPFLNAQVIDPTKSLVGACVPSTNCTPGSTCQSASVGAGTCVKVDTSQTLCVTGCEISWSAAGDYSDNCDDTHVCQPLGASGDQAFTCLYNGVNSTNSTLAAVGGQAVQPLGSKCSAVERPCAKGDLCAPTGVCAQYCRITSNDISGCPGAQKCCPITTFATSQTSGFCADSCL